MKKKIAVEVAKDESYVATYGPSLLPDGEEVPFLGKDGEQHMIPCNNAQHFTACTTERNGKEPAFGVIAMATSKGVGLTCSFSAADLRSLAVQALAMAEWVDRENA